MSSITNFLDTNFHVIIQSSPFHSFIFHGKNKLFKSTLKTHLENASFFKSLTNGNFSFPITIHPKASHLFKVIKVNSQKRLLLDIDEAITPYGLTPLHIAVITENFKAVKFLCKAGADINKSDLKGWTPLHHAAMLCNQRFFHFLCENQADRTIKNSLDGTPDNLRLMLNPHLFPSYEAKIPMIKDGKKQIIDGKEFKDLTNAIFLKEMHVSSEILYRSWITCKIPPSSITSFRRKTIFCV